MSASPQPAAVKERPILFSAPLVRALLAGTKTVTRRLVRPQPQGHYWQSLPPEARYRHHVGVMEDGAGLVCASVHHITVNGRESMDEDPPARCPFGVPGDRLWVREAWHTDENDLAYARAKHEDAIGPSPIYYRATEEIENPHAGWTWRPSIHMPRWASRIDLEVTEVRVERLQEITEEEAQAEGFDGRGPLRESSRDQFAEKWDELHGAGSFAANPWIWRIGFRVLRPSRAEEGSRR